VIRHLSTTAISPASAPHPCRFHASPFSNRPPIKHDEDPAEVDTATAIPYRRLARSFEGRPAGSFASIFISNFQFKFKIASVSPVI
jgi:hypothetical protein